ncbi:His-Xaa-Ser system protein HxsD [Chitinophaga cymbidii]|uniref:His-Xaa-Ser system protein HxsD n=1 Tax=Chitinophaga cymbidii TaxID=1096750 RepID=A0A512RKC4_9BACT|nr:His-Xaa-Ser system protein HxsD [Chitinophaga cymbidii]GEP96120.1 hypothetical protein CCY01nite_23800 [Chitinophaga cymbidii]
MDYQVTNNGLTLCIDARLYNEAVIYKCFYWYGKDFDTEIELKDNLDYKVTLRPLDGNIEVDWKELIDRIRRNLIDFKLRDIVATETKTIRELIVAKAFAHYEIEELPKTGISDPVGFDPESI